MERKKEDRKVLVSFIIFLVVVVDGSDSPKVKYFRSTTPNVNFAKVPSNSPQNLLSCFLSISLSCCFLQMLVSDPVLI